MDALFMVLNDLGELFMYSGGFSKLGLKVKVSSFAVGFGFVTLLANNGTIWTGAANIDGVGDNRLGYTERKFGAQLKGQHGSEAARSYTTADPNGGAVNTMEPLVHIVHQHHANNQGDDNNSNNNDDEEGQPAAVRANEVHAIEYRQVTDRIGGLQFKSVACGNAHVIALTHAGQVWTWGRNTTGALGVRTGDNGPVHVEFDNLLPISHIWATPHTCYTKSSPDVFFHQLARSLMTDFSFTVQGGDSMRCHRLILHSVLDTKSPLYAELNAPNSTLATSNLLEQFSYDAVNVVISSIYAVEGLPIPVKWRPEVLQIVQKLQLDPKVVNMRPEAVVLTVNGSHLRAKLAGFALNPRFADTRVFYGNEAQLIPAHRFILAGRSEFFSGMFTGSFRESREHSRVDVSSFFSDAGITEEAFIRELIENVFSSMYGHELTNKHLTLEVATNCLGLADAWICSSARLDHCFLAAVQNDLTPENVLRVLISLEAIRASEAGLRESVFGFAVTHHDTIKLSDEYSALSAELRTQLEAKATERALEIERANARRQELADRKNAKKKGKDKKKSDKKKGKDVGRSSVASGSRSPRYGNRNDENDNDDDDDDDDDGAVELELELGAGGRSSSLSSL
eukprot:comp21980_c0_seq1/m.50328 comp21980_c0_seq1/g.50328  ORF comp21980_c0_seq1/g.50328 comp21980_c0_seq1/m.50328 type:complete len:625 (-) comp21980_c0_seq1:410-2284(-)